MNLTLLVGNPQAGSRTLKVAEAVVARITPLLPDPQVRTIELADHASDLFVWPSQTIDELTAAVAASDVLVVASPTYKATYTGMLKAFLDRYGTDGLAGVTAVAIMTANAPAHAMAVEVFLRPLLVELGASVPTRGLFFPMAAMEKLDETVGTWADRNLSSPGLFGPMTRPVTT